MPSTTGFDYGIRAGLVNKGIDDKDIGFDKGTGTVTVKGQNFIKAGRNYNGTTFTNEQDFNNAWKDYQKSLQQQAAGVGTALNTMATNTVNPTPTVNPNQNNNPFDQQYNNLLKSLMAQAQNPVSVDVNQIYASPQFAAQQAQAQRAAHQGIRAAQESLGASGFGRSTALAERAQGIQNDATNFLNTQVLPQLMAQAQAEKQQQLQNQLTMLGQLAQQQAVFDNRFNTANNLALDQGQLTGRFMTDRDRQAMPLLEQLIAFGNEFGTANPQRQSELRAAADANRSRLTNMGVDPSLFDPNLSTQQRIAALNQLGTPTLAAQNQQFNQAQQEWENNFKQGQFDWQKAQQIWENAFQEKNFEQQMKDAAASRGLQWASLNQRQKEFIADQKFREKQFEMEQGGSTLTQDQVNAYNNLLDAYTGDRDPQEALEFATSPQGKKNALDYGLTEGLYNQLIDTLQSKVPQTIKPTANQIQAEYISNIDQMSADQRMAFFTNEKSNIVADLGLNGYEKLKQQYGIY